MTLFIKQPYSFISPAAAVEEMWLPAFHWLLQFHPNPKSEKSKTRQNIGLKHWFKATTRKFHIVLILEAPVDKNGNVSTVITTRGGKSTHMLYSSRNTSKILVKVLKYRL